MNLTAVYGCLSVAGGIWFLVIIVVSVAWMALVERIRPDVWDIAGTALCVAGSLVILLPGRG